jgi:hypothetical protein
MPYALPQCKGPGPGAALILAHSCLYDAWQLENLAWAIRNIPSPLCKQFLFLFFPFPQKNHLQMIQKEAIDNKQTMMDGLSTGILLAIN